MTPSATPYATAAPTYARKGWSPIPLPPRRKAPPPVGWTGYAAPTASGADVHEWAENGHAAANIGLRTPETVLGLDLDAYDGKPGHATMLAAVDRLGPLPPTPRSSSRPDDPVSGIRFYRVPPGRRWADVLGPGVEVIHHGHRYAVAAPSIHPEGRVYRWYVPEGPELIEPPAVADLPALPTAWVTDLDRGDVAARAHKADLHGTEVAAFLDALPDGAPCPYVARLTDDLATQLAGATSRHDVARDGIGRMVRAGEQGHRGAVAGLDTVQSLWLDALTRGKPRDPDPGEWSRMVTGAVAIVTHSPTSVMDVGCCPAEPPPVTTLPPIAAPDSSVDPEAGAAHHTDAATEAALDQAHALALEVEREAYRIRVRDAAREKVAGERAQVVHLPGLTRLDAFLAVPDEDVTHRVGGLWPTGGRVVLSAQHKAGKTTLSGNLIRSLVDGDPFLDAFDVTPAGRVLLLDNELDPRMLRRWLRDQGIVNVAAVELIPLRGRLSTFDILDAATRARWAAHLRPADVLVFDCLRPALDALALSEDKDAGRFLEALDELTAEAGIGETLLVHHMGHNGERSRGDSRILDWPDAVWKLVKDAEDEADTAQPRRYFSAYGRDVDQAETLLTFNPATRHLSAAGGSRRDHKVDGALDTVLDALAEAPHPMSGRQIEDRLKDTGPGRDTIRAALKRAEAEGLTLVIDGPKRSRLHLINPTSARVRGSARAVRGDHSSECASAPIEGARSLTPQPPSGREEKPAHSTDLTPDKRCGCGAPIRTSFVRCDDCNATNLATIRADLERNTA